MKSMTKPCYLTCIPKKYRISENVLKQAEKIVAEKDKNKKAGRPPIDSRRALSGIYYILRTGAQWNALPQCFGSCSAVHRYFQYLVRIDFFTDLWTAEIYEYDEQKGLDMKNQSADCAQTKAPLGGLATGPSPVDRAKRGSKRSVIVEGNGIPIGLAVGGANIHDSKLFCETLKSIPNNLEKPQAQKMRLDAAYDSEEVRTGLFNSNYLPRIAPNQRRKSKPKNNPYADEPKLRWVVERSHSWANRFRRILIRWEKKMPNFVGMLQFCFAITISGKL